jgi:hypothetical protein
MRGGFPRRGQGLGASYARGVALVMAVTALVITMPGAWAQIQLPSQQQPSGMPSPPRTGIQPPKPQAARDAIPGRDCLHRGRILFKRLEVWLSSSDVRSSFLATERTKLAFGGQSPTMLSTADGN